MGLGGALRQYIEKRGERKALSESDWAYKQRLNAIQEQKKKADLRYRYMKEKQALERRQAEIKKYNARNRFTKIRKAAAHVQAFQKNIGGLGIVQSSGQPFKLEGLNNALWGPKKAVSKGTSRRKNRVKRKKSRHKTRQKRPVFHPFGL